MYGAKIQYAQDSTQLPPLDKIETRRVQAINGTLLYYTRAIDPTQCYQHLIKSHHNKPNLQSSP